ncbi:PREDICTED: serine/threonine-protein phosphatase 4 regulatory subunit 2-A-like isoform X1 [Cyprinodon variegatus]|uniref:Serine/threonine-protein phosphatase 4 regulatory subunit 2-A-like n=1 Tax=Cyprinodon variegatus TaxID=28743 RepID=A0A3Q2DKP7_CYPVA|nr:PREDICTED: serine/threonine-protein phosphatase 4 regulatory subunit 2-A-like isoform X1 [Cyprinodon variegatus]
MDTDALSEAFQDFEKKGKKEICPTLDQFLWHVAKTGQPMIPWSQFKTYFLFKLDKVMEDFHASSPEERDTHNPNLEYIPFEDMKKRILKIVDGYNGIPFTIQRLCELLTDPKRNYTGTDKFLRGLEKNVMVVSYLHSMSEKNGTSTVNRMNGVMFLGNSSLNSDSSRSVNGPGIPKTLNRPKLSSSSSLSTNGLPECSGTKERDGITEAEEHHLSDRDTPPSEDEQKQNYGIKNKHLEEEEEYDDSKQEPKKLKTREREDESSGDLAQENSAVTSRSQEETCDPESDSETSHDAPCISDSHEQSSSHSQRPEKEGESSEASPATSVQSSVDQTEQAASSEAHSTYQEDSAVVKSSSSSSDADALSNEKALSGSHSPQLSTEVVAETRNNAETAVEPGEQD